MIPLEASASEGTRHLATDLSIGKGNGFCNGKRRKGERIRFSMIRSCFAWLEFLSSAKGVFSWFQGSLAAFAIEHLYPLSGFTETCFVVYFTVSLILPSELFCLVKVYFEMN